MALPVLGVVGTGPGHEMDRMGSADMADNQMLTEKRVTR